MLLRDRIGGLAEVVAADPELARQLFGRLVDRHAELANQMRRTTISAVAMAGFFVLLSGPDVHEVAVLGVGLTDVGLILPVVPPVVVGLLTRAITLANEKGVLRDVYSGLVEVAWPALHATKLHFVLLSSGLIFSTGRSPIRAGTRFDRAQVVSQNIESLLLVLIFPVGFGGYAFYRLFGVHGPASPLVWISLLVTVAMFVILLLTRRGPEIYPPGYAPEDGPTTPSTGQAEAGL